MKKNNLSALVLGLLIAIIGGLLIGELAVSSSMGKIALLLFAAVASGITVGLRCPDDNETRGILGGICGAVLFAVYHLTLLYNGYEYQHIPTLYFMIGIIGCSVMSAGCAVKAGEA